MTIKRSGDPPFEFVHREDLHVLPVETLDAEVNLHGGFATDPRPGADQLYFGMPECGILRTGPLRVLRREKAEAVELPQHENRNHWRRLETILAGQ